MTVPPASGGSVGPHPAGVGIPCVDGQEGTLRQRNLAVFIVKPTPAGDGAVGPHPSLKPQSFLRQLVRAVLPLGRGVVLDPFAGSDSTLAASNAVGYQSVSVEQDRHYFLIAKEAVPKLSALTVNGDAEASPYDCMRMDCL